MATNTDDRIADPARQDRDRQTTTDSPWSSGAGSPDARSAVDAACDRPLPNQVILEARTDRAIVRIEVDGEVGPDRLLDVADDVYDDVAIVRIDGCGARKGFRFSGTMVDLEVVEGDVDASIELHREDPVRDRRLSIHAQGTDVAYRVAVSGAVGSDLESDVETPPVDGEADDVASGTVRGSGVDEYRFTGEITGFDVSSDAVLVMVDGRVVDPGALG